MKTVDVPLTLRAAGTAAAGRKRRRANTRSVIEFAKVMVVLYGIAAIIGGIALAAMSTGSDSGFSGYGEHPYIGLGLSIGFVNLVFASFMFAVLQFMEWRIGD